MNLLITGGAGYIGSHVVLESLKKGYNVTVFDDLSTANKININRNVNFIQGSTSSELDLKNLFAKNKYDAVIHLDASKSAPDSMLHPYHYAKNNIWGSVKLIRASVKYGVKFFICTHIDLPSSSIPKDLIKNFLLYCFISLSLSSSSSL